MTKERIQTPDAPQPIGPYSQAIRAGGLIYTAGQVALRPDGTFAGGDAAAQTHVAVANLRAVLEAGGASLDSIVKTTIFLKDMNDFAQVNEAYGEYFGQSAPARSTVEVARLPKDALVEIEAIAIVE
ncbi:MAG TPA: RidA family protein [Candidatus Kapabacteria bacterium]|nr:RidA family protein [Candidatus Kapabacteria bacterium]